MSLHFQETQLFSFDIFKCFLNKKNMWKKVMGNVVKFTIKFDGLNFHIVFVSFSTFYTANKYSFSG